MGMLYHIAFKSSAAYSSAEEAKWSIRSPRPRRRQYPFLPPVLIS
jgi:hypothetical protein